MGSSALLAGLKGIHWMACRVRISGSNQLKVEALAANKMVATLAFVTPLLLPPATCATHTNTWKHTGRSAWQLQWTLKKFEDGVLGLGDGRACQNIWVKPWPWRRRCCCFPLPPVAAHSTQAGLILGLKILALRVKCLGLGLGNTVVAAVTSHL